MKKIIAFLVVLFFIPFTLFSQSFGLKFGPYFGKFNVTNGGTTINSSQPTTFGLSAFYQITNRKNVNFETTIEWGRRSGIESFIVVSPGGRSVYRMPSQDLLILSIYPVINVSENRRFSISFGPKFGFDLAKSIPYSHLNSKEFFLFVAGSYEYQIVKQLKIKLDLSLNQSLSVYTDSKYSTTEIGIAIGLRRWF